MKSAVAWTPSEIATEKEYRRQERIGISCGSKPPPDDVMRLAQAEADAWEALMLSGNRPVHEQVRDALLPGFQARLPNF